MKNVKAIGTYAAEKPLETLQINRRALTERDVEIEIMFCGVCHSDLHAARNEWKGSNYPLVPGHEIVGKVTATGNLVKKFTIGQMVAVGVIVDSCGKCGPCVQELEQYCDLSPTYTYNSPDKHLGGQTFGGYSKLIVTDEKFVFAVPENLDPAAAAPLLCAGITTYSPLRYWKVGPGKKVGVIGIGGLGHMAVKFAAAFGAEVIAFTHSASKKEEAKRLGAHDVVVSSDKEDMKRYHRKLDFIVNTVSAQHDINKILGLLTFNGVHALVGLPMDPFSLEPFSIVDQRKIFTGSSIGSVKETEEMLKFCGEHGITADIELIQPNEINEAWERMLKGDVRYRFVLDLRGL